MSIEGLKFLALHLSFDGNITCYLVDVTHYICHVLNVLSTTIDDFFHQIGLSLYLYVSCLELVLILILLLLGNTVGKVFTLIARFGFN